jgi:hypothetical protein
MEEWYNSANLDLCTRWKCMISFTPLLLYSRGNCPRYPLDRRLGGPRDGLGATEKTLSSAGKRTPAVQLVARRYAG